MSALSAPERRAPKSGQKVASATTTPSHHTFPKLAYISLLKSSTCAADRILKSLLGDYESSALTVKLSAREFHASWRMHGRRVNRPLDACGSSICSEWEALQAPTRRGDERGPAASTLRTHCAFRPRPRLTARSDTGASWCGQKAPSRRRRPRPSRRLRVCFRPGP